jgi:hypothetical protein
VIYSVPFSLLYCQVDVILGRRGSKVCHLVLKFLVDNLLVSLDISKEG